MNTSTAPSRRTPRFSDGTNNGIIMLALPVAILTVILLCALYRHLTPDTANGSRLSSSMTNGPISRSLRATNVPLPANVDDLHCWVSPAQRGDAATTARVVCNVYWNDRAQDLGDMDNPANQWKRSIDTPAARAMGESALNFEVFRSVVDQKLVVLSNVDPDHVTVEQASNVVNTMMRDFRDSVQERPTMNPASASENAQASLALTIGSPTTGWSPPSKATSVHVLDAREPYLPWPCCAKAPSPVR